MTFRDTTGDLLRAQKFALRARKRRRRAATLRTPEMWEAFKKAHPVKVGAHPHDHTGYMLAKLQAEEWLREQWERGEFDEVEPLVPAPPKSWPQVTESHPEPVLTAEQSRNLARHAVQVMLDTEDAMVQAERKSREKKT